MQIVLFLLLILAVLIIFVAKKDTFSTNAKIYISISFAVLIALGWAFNFYSNESASRNRELINIFEQGNDIECSGYKVNSKNFIFVSGTLSFVAKSDVKSLRGVVLDISTCKKIK
ncbi:MAG: hypothetical protein R3331_08300 [Sulfurospirillaceae bacterium]|nr:hypothetical protein [Sulfurospirillaceae bacterium]